MGAIAIYLKGFLRKTGPLLTVRANAKPTVRHTKVVDIPRIKVFKSDL
jgi:hypothetical protein